MNHSNKRGYTLIEPPIHRLLNWEMDVIVACLEVLRRKIPLQFKQWPPSLEYDLLSVSNPHGPPYPAIGLHCPNEEDLEKIPDWLDIHKMISDWVNDIGIDQLKKQATEIKIISWDELNKKKHYPERLSE